MLTSLYLSEASVLTLLLKDSPRVFPSLDCLNNAKVLQNHFFSKYEITKVQILPQIRKGAQGCSKRTQINAPKSKKCSNVATRKRERPILITKLLIHNSLLNNSIVDCVEKHKTDRSGTSNTKRWIFCISYPLLPPWKLRRREGIQG